MGQWVYLALVYMRYIRVDDEIHPQQKKQKAYEEMILYLVWTSYCCILLDLRLGQYSLIWGVSLNAKLRNQSFGILAERTRTVSVKRMGEVQQIRNEFY